MPFNGRLFEPDDSPLTDETQVVPPDALSLPDELVALGEQLSDDAEHLAACYPAPPAVEAISSGPATLSRRPAPWFIRSAATVAALSAAAAIIIAATRLSEPPKADHRVQQTSGAMPAMKRRPIAAAAAEVTSNQEPAAAPASIASVRTLSGPELEAVLDILERESSEARVSF